MAIKETQTTIKIDETEKKDLISAIKKLTENKIGFNSVTLTESENKIIEFLKSI